MKPKGFPMLEEMIERIQTLVVEELKADSQSFHMTMQKTVTIRCSLTLSATSTSTSNQDCESGIFPVLPIINPAAILGYKLQKWKLDDSQGGTRSQSCP
ncbi:hypothetical protein BSKO_01542 [Bryopsis sp. KO-2023]|nr:hypothetical protein BSKO_01542 [Bryopsis sp. KO-2023]